MAAHLKNRSDRNLATHGVNSDRHPRLLFIASRPPGDTTAGALLMDRHLRFLRDRYEVHFAHLEPPLAAERDFTLLHISPFYRRLRRSRFGHFAEAIDATLGIAVPRRQLRQLMRRVQPDAVLLVAESPVFLPAAAVARSLGLPIVTIVHDWSPVWLDLRGKLQAPANRSFGKACRNSTITLSVSPELASEFGPAPRHRVLAPIPGTLPESFPAPAPGFHALYAGNFHYFQPEEVSSLCRELLRAGRPDLLRLLGPEPEWSTPALQLVRDGGFYAGFAKGPDLAAAFSAAGALLAVLPFAPRWTAFSRFSFPSKLTEYCGQQRPIMVWGPEQAAAVKWARRSGAALAITDPSPAAVAAALLNLESDQELRQRLVAAARQEALSRFAPASLNAILADAISDAMRAAIR